MKFALTQLIEMKHDNAQTYLAQIYCHLKNPENIKEFILLVAAFFTLWRAAFTTHMLPQFYRNLYSKNKLNDKGGIDFNEQLKLFRELLFNKISGNPENDVKATKEKWIEACMNNNELSYSTLKGVCQMLVLIDIANTHTENNWKWSFTKELDVEHIIPTNEQTESPDSDLEDWKQSLGNLTLLPVKVNRSIQDIEWSEKKNVYASLSSTFRNSDIEGNKFPAVKIYLESENRHSMPHLGSLSELDDFTKDEIKRRTRDILCRAWDYLMNTWMRPKE